MDFDEWILDWIGLTKLNKIFDRLQSSWMKLKLLFLILPKRIGIFEGFFGAVGGFNQLESSLDRLHPIE